MPRYWVIGGEYASTEFRDMAGDNQPQRHGPFATYEEAKKAWQTYSWANVDSAHVRYTIIREDDDSAAA